MAELSDNPTIAETIRPCRLGDFLVRYVKMIISRGDTCRECFHNCLFLYNYNLNKLQFVIEIFIVY